MKSALLVASGLALGAKPIGGPVTYHNPGASLTHLCADLSQIMGENLKVSTLLAKEVVAVKVTNVDGTALKGKIADSVHGVWVDQDGGQILKLDPSQDRKDQRAHQDLLVQGFQRSLNAEAKTLAAQPAFDAQAANAFAAQVSETLSLDPKNKEFAKRLNDLADRSPGHRAINRLLAGFSPSELAELPPRIRVVYSNNPNQAQRPLSGTAIDAASQFIQEQTYWANQAKGAMANNPRFRALPDFLTSIDAPKGAPAKVLVGLFRESENGRVRVDLKIADSAGRVLCHSTSSLKPAFEAVPANGVSNDQFAKKLSLTDESLQIAPDGYLRHPMSDGVKAKLANPIDIDPLSLGYGQTLVGLADSEGVDLVADLSDQMADGAIRDGMSSTDADYLKSLGARGQSVKFADGWLSVTPTDSYFARNSRADRDLMQEYVRGQFLTNFPLEREAACAVGLPDPLDNFLPSEVVSVIKARPIGLQNVALLRFYGSLSEEDVRAAQSSSGLSLGSLNDKALQYLNEIVYGEMGSLLVDGAVQGIGRDASECLAEGYARNGAVYLKIESSPAVFDLSKDRQRFSMNQGSVSPGEIAMMQYSRAHPDRYPEIAEKAALIDTACFCPGTFSKYQFQFKLAPYVSSNGELESRSLDDTKPMRLADLPGDFQAKVSAQFSQIEKDEQAAGFGAPTKTIKTSTNP